jgi:hypothetical protein
MTYKMVADGLLHQAIPHPFSIDQITLVALQPENETRNRIEHGPWIVDKGSLGGGCLLWTVNARSWHDDASSLALCLIKQLAFLLLVIRVIFQLSLW